MSDTEWQADAADESGDYWFPDIDLPLRLAMKVQITDECWLWVGQLSNKGYGLIYAGAFALPGRSIGKRGAHVVIWEMLRGPVPDGLQLDHLCRVRECVNPAHLEPVTPSENQRRAAAALTGCRKFNHPWIERNTYTDRYGRRRCRECARIRDRGRVRPSRRAA